MEISKAPYISESNFQNSKSKTFLIFWEMKLSFHKLKKLFIFQTNKKSALKSFLVSCGVFVTVTAVKHLVNSCDYLNVM